MFLAHTARFAKVYKGPAAFRKRHVAAAAAQGYPLTRDLFLYYPDDRNTYGLRYQYLLGPHLMVAPAVNNGAASVEVYFPKGDRCVNLWTGTDAGNAGEWMRLPAPM